ncbi:MAG: putative DNA binding protein [Natronomonas sp.]|jgi:predicted DNA binding protein
MYVEFHHQSEILRRTLREVEGVDVVVRNIATGPETPLRLIAAVTGDGCGRFHSLVAEDPSIAELKLLENSDLRRLYWMQTVPGTVDQRAYGAAVDSGGVYLQSRWAGNGWYTTMNYPDQDSFQDYQRRIDEGGMEIEPTVVRVGQYLISGGAFDLTEKQEGVLQEAIEGGYFDIPRGSTLGDIADRLAISEQAASERLRRAMGSLARAAVTNAAEESLTIDN